jgi:hypothetical protein
MTLSKKF